MASRTVGGNVIEVESPEGPARLFFKDHAKEVAQEREKALAQSKGQSKLLPPGAGRPRKTR